MWAVLQGAKRGCAEVSEDFIVQTMHKHKKALSQAIPEMDEVTTEKIRRKFRDIWRDKRRRFGYNAFGTTPQMERALRKGGNPNDHACWERSRKQGGRMALVRERLLQELGFSSDDEDRIIPDRLLWRMVEVSPGVVHEEFSVPRTSLRFHPPWRSAGLSKILRAVMGPFTPGCVVFWNL
jgi:hypothetical protein